MFRKKIKVLFLCCFFAGVLNFSEFFSLRVSAADQIVGSDCENEARLQEYRELLKDYFMLCNGRKFVEVSEHDKAEVKELAEKLREFKKQLANENIKPENLDDYVCDKIEREAGKFNVVDRKTFVELDSNPDNLIMWQKCGSEVSQRIRNGEYKMNRSFKEGLRGNHNYFNRSPVSYYELSRGDLDNFYGGLCLYVGCSNFWRMLSVGDDLLEDNFDKEESRRFEMKIPVAGDMVPRVLGFSLNLKDAKQIDLNTLKRYSYVLMFEYPEEFGFVNEILSLKPVIKKLKKMHESSPKHDDEHGLGCWHSIKLDDFFDYYEQIQAETQKELFGDSLFDLNLCDGKNEEIKAKMEDLRIKINTDEYYQRLRQNILNAGKKEHIINENYYLLKNYALLAKLLGYDVVSKEYHNKHIEVKPTGYCIIVDAKNVSVCCEEFVTEKECENLNDYKKSEEKIRKHYENEENHG